MCCFEYTTDIPCSLASSGIFLISYPTLVFMQINDISGYLPGRIVFFLVHTQKIISFCYAHINTTGYLCSLVYPCRSNRNLCCV